MLFKITQQLINGNCLNTNKHAAEIKTLCLNIFSTSYSQETISMLFSLHLLICALEQTMVHPQTTLTFQESTSVW